MSSKVKRPRRTVAVPLPTTAPAGYTLAGDGTTQTLTGDFLCCRRRWLLKLWRWVNPAKQRTLFYGTLGHAVLSGAYKARRPLAPSEVAGILRGCKPPSYAVITTDELEEDHARAAGVLDAYMWYYTKEFKTRKYQPEQVFEVTYNPAGLPITLRGRIDITTTAADGIWLWEHKFKSRIDEESIMLQLGYDLQTTLYAQAKRLTANVIPAGVLYNVIRKPQIKKFSNPKDLYERCFKEAKADPEHYFKRWAITLGKNAAGMLTKFSEEMGAITEDMAACLKQPHRCYPNSRACDAPYKCDFINACASGTLAGYIQKENLFEELIDEEA